MAYATPPPPPPPLLMPLLLLLLLRLPATYGGNGTIITSFEECLREAHCSATCGCLVCPAGCGKNQYCACDKGCACAGPSPSDGTCCGCTQAAVMRCHKLWDCIPNPCGARGGVCTPSSGCTDATKPRPTCEFPENATNYTQYYTCDFTHPGGACVRDSCGDVISCTTCQVRPGWPNASRPSGVQIVAAVQPVLERAARHFNSSFSFGWADGRADDAAGVVVGTTINGSCANKPCRRSLVPVGSTTKAWTSIAVLQFVDKGALTLDTPAYTLIDPVLDSQCGFTMEEIFTQRAYGPGGGSRPAIRLVTVKHLLQMTSGIGDYDGYLYEAWTLMFGGSDDLLPCDLMRMLNTTLHCTSPPCAGYYSSMNFVLLGFVAQALHKLPRWHEWEQISVIPAHRRHLFNETIFGGLGTCDSHPLIASQWASLVSSDNTEVYWFDYRHYSCLNGWSMGNAATTGREWHPSSLLLFFW